MFPDLLFLIFYISYFSIRIRNLFLSAILLFYSLKMHENNWNKRIVFSFLIFLSNSIFRFLSSFLGLQDDIFAFLFLLPIYSIYFSSSFLGKYHGISYLNNFSPFFWRSETRRFQQFKRHSDNLSIRALRTSARELISIYTSQVKVFTTFIVNATKQLLQLFMIKDKDYKSDKWRFVYRNILLRMYTRLRRFHKRFWERFKKGSLLFW